MGPKRVKSSVSSAAVTGAPRAWEPALISAALEEDSWMVNIALVVENQEEDEVHTRALSQAVCGPQRRLFSLVSWDKVLQQVNELGNPKTKKAKDVPAYYEVTEAARALLASGEALPPSLVAKLLKFQFLNIKQKDLQRREAEKTPSDSKLKEKANKSSKAKPSSGKGSAKAKGKKGPEAPPPIKKDTALRRRGEEDDTSKYIDDEPEDGAHHYIIVLGVYNPQLVALLADLGVRVSSVIRISSQNYGGAAARQVESGSAPEDNEAEQRRKETLRGSLQTFWKYLEPVLATGSSGSALSQVLRLQYLVREGSLPRDRGDPDMQLEYASKVFENVACLMYDCQDWRRQHQHYLSNMQLIHVPEGPTPPVQEKPPAVTESLTTLQPSSPSSRKKGQGDEIPPGSSLPPPTPPEGQVDAPRLLDVDTRFYNELLRDVPDTLLSVPVILHCMLEQVVASEEGLLPPSEVMQDPRADGLDPAIAEHFVSVVDSLSLSEKEKKNLYNIFRGKDREERSSGPRGPRVFSFHDQIRQRSHQTKVLAPVDPAAIEELMLQKLPVVRRLQQPPHELRPQRLGHAHELLHYCNTDLRPGQEVARAFQLLTLESLTLSGLDEFGELQGTGALLGGRCPWDDPAAFARQMMQESRAAGGDGADSPEEPQDIGGMTTSRTDLRDVQKTQRRSLSDWCYSEQHEPAVLIQVLQEALGSYRCLDSYPLPQDNALLLVLHNPMDAARRSRESWDTALHCDVSLRTYLELVADSISHWVQEEESQYQKEKADVGAPKSAAGEASAPSDLPPSKKKARRSASPRKSRSPKGSGSRPGSQTELSTPEPGRNPFIREGSLKAWKEEQDRLKEEERLKQEKKNVKGKSGGKKRGGSKEGPDSEPKRSPSAHKKNTKEDEPKNPEPAPALPDGPEEPPKKTFKFIGYDMGDHLIQVSGGCHCLFPTDGGQIQVEHTHFEKGSTYVKAKIQKDGHEFLVHIVNPRKIPPAEQDDYTQMDQKGCSGSERRSISEFGSFSATLHSGIRLSLSHYGSSGRGTEDRDPVLEEMLRFPSVHPPSLPPAPPQPPPSPGKGQKSPRASRSRTPVAPAMVETPEVAPVTPPVTPAAKPVHIPVFQALNVSYPSGLLLTFTSDYEHCNNGRIGPRLLIRQTYPVKVRNGQLYKHSKMAETLETSRVITAEGSVVRCMLDGSTQILIPDGTVIRSPDSGAVLEPRPPATLPEGASETVGTDLQPAPPVAEEPPTEVKRGTVTGKGGSKPLPPATKAEATDPAPAPDSLPATPNTPAVNAGTWITTRPTGEQIGTCVSQRLDLKPLLISRATDPVTRAVMTTREDQVVTVLQTDGMMTAEHADGTRITTFYQDVDVPIPGYYEETGEIPQNVTKKVKFIRVENPDFSTVILNCEENTCYAVSGDGTEVLARPDGSYQVFPPNSGCLSINREGIAIYSPRTSCTAQTPTRPEDLPPASYIMSHTQSVISEVLDPEGNLFQVMLDGSTSVVIAGAGTCEEEESEEKDKVHATIVQQPPEVYDLHAPRFFMVNADGSGSELLRNREVEDFLAACYCDPTIAVIREPTQEAPGVQTITVLQPLPDSPPWTTKKHPSNIVPPNLLSRDWAAFPPTERASPGPPLGIGIWKGLCIGSAAPLTPRTPSLKCPGGLKMRQLHLYEPVGPERRQQMERSLLEYIRRVLEKEEGRRELNVKEPRSAEETGGAAELLQLVLSLTDTQEPPEPPTPERIQAADVASLYENAVSPPAPPAPPMAKPQRSVHDRETLRLEIQEQKELLAAIRGHNVPPYFQSELGLEFLQKQTPDLTLLSERLPPFSRSQQEEPEAAPPVHREDQEPGCRLESEETLAPPGLTGPSLQPSADETRPGLIPAQRYHSLDLDVTGHRRRDRVRLPASILSGKPACVPNSKFAVEEPVRRRVRTASTSPPAEGRGQHIPRGFHLIPSVVQFGVLREGCTYSTSVTIKNIGVELCRFRVKPPPPSTGLRVTYTPGPVAAGMNTRMELELFAMAVGLEGPEGAADCAHCIEIQSEVEALYLPVTATVLTEGIYESGSEGKAAGLLGPGVRLISTAPHSRLDVLWPRRAPETADV